MELIKTNLSNYTIDKKYFVPNNYELKCGLASKAHPELHEVDHSFFTDGVKEVDYEIEGDLVKILFPVEDVITEITVDQSTGEIKVQFDYLPQELETTVKTTVETFLAGILNRHNNHSCDSCRYKHQYTILGTCKWVYWD
jgi:hypothetical protein